MNCILYVICDNENVVFRWNLFTVQNRGWCDISYFRILRKGDIVIREVTTELKTETLK